MGWNGKHSPRDAHWLAKILLTSLITFSFAAVARKRPCPSTLNELAQETIASNEFAVARGLDLLAVMLGPTFTDDFPEDGHIMNLGAGELVAEAMYFDPDRLILGGAYEKISRWIEERKALSKEELAIARFLYQLRQRTLLNRSNFTSVSYKVVTNQVRDWNLQAKDRLALFTGEWFEKISNRRLTERFGKAHRILDVYGVMAYTWDPAKVLRKYFALLRKHGWIHLVLGYESKQDALLRDQVIFADRDPISIADWMRKTEGVDFTPIRTQVFGAPAILSAILRPIPGVPLKVQKLRLVKIVRTLNGKAIKPPIRYFEPVP